MDCIKITFVSSVEELLALCGTVSMLALRTSIFGEIA